MSDKTTLLLALMILDQHNLAPDPNNPGNMMAVVGHAPLQRTMQQIAAQICSAEQKISPSFLPGFDLSPFLNQ